MRAPHALAMCSMLASAAIAGPALAQDEWQEDGGEKPPPDDRPAKKKDDAKVDPNAKPSRILLDLKLGPGFTLSENGGATRFGLQVNVGYAVATSLIVPNDAFYITLSPWTLIGEDFVIAAPLGAQYDLPLRWIPYDGISAYVRASVGYAFYVQPRAPLGDGFHGLAVQPALGAKLALSKNFHVGIEPAAFDITTLFPPENRTVATATAVTYQVYIFAGARF